MRGSVAHDGVFGGAVGVRPSLRERLLEAGDAASVFAFVHQLQLHRGGSPMPRLSLASEILRQIFV